MRELLNLEGLDSSDTHVERLFERYDGDNSGTISRAEFEPFLHGRCSGTSAFCVFFLQCQPGAVTDDGWLLQCSDADGGRGGASRPAGGQLLRPQLFGQSVADTTHIPSPTHTTQLGYSVMLCHVRLET